MLKSLKKSKKKKKSQNTKHRPIANVEQPNSHSADQTHHELTHSEACLKALEYHCATRRLLSCRSSSLVKIMICHDFACSSSEQSRHQRAECAQQLTCDRCKCLLLLDMHTNRAPNRDCKNINVATTYLYAPPPFFFFVCGTHEIALQIGITHRLTSEERALCLQNSSNEQSSEL